MVSKELQKHGYNVVQKWQLSTDNTKKYWTIDPIKKLEEEPELGNFLR